MKLLLKISYFEKRWQNHMFSKNIFLKVWSLSQMVKSITNRCSDVFGCFLYPKNNHLTIECEFLWTFKKRGENEKSRKIHKCPLDWFGLGLLLVWHIIHCQQACLPRQRRRPYGRFFYALSCELIVDVYYKCPLTSFRMIWKEWVW